MSLNSFSSLMDVLSHLVKSGIDLVAKQTQITDLDEHSFHHILQYLPVYDLFMSRLVNKYFLKYIDSYLQTRKELVYNCKLNGVHMSNGEYLFNGLAFEFMISKMPNIRVLRFKKCDKMFGALATTNFDVIKSLTNNIIMLNELYLTRCRSLDTRSLSLLVETFPNLTHLTITLYNEPSVEILTKGLTNLKYFNLDESVLENYGTQLRPLGFKIHTFIAAPDHNNNKSSIIDGLINGHGRKLKHLELTIQLMECEADVIARIGESFSELTSLKCNIESKRTVYTNSLLIGLNRLSKLKTLHLKEKIVSPIVYSVFDDTSILSIMENCSLLEDLTITTDVNKKTITHGITEGITEGMRDNGLTDLSLGRIDQLLPELKELSLKSANITDRTLDSIERLHNLKSLRLDSLVSVSSDGLQNFMCNSMQINRLEVLNSLNNTKD